jgi:DNA-binding response OmpR family regulator
MEKQLWSKYFRYNIKSMAKKPFVLFIEDDPVIAKLYRERLEREKLQVVTASTGEEGLVWAMQSRPDLILLDLVLPGKDGIDVLRILKTEIETKNIPVIIITAVLDETKRDQTIRAGALDHIIKTEIKPVDLVTRVKSVLANRS